VEKFLSRHADAVIGTLCGFDRLVFRGTLRQLAHRAGMMAYLWAVRVRLKDFGGHAEELSGRLKEVSEALARQTARSIRYLASSAISKEEIARADRIEPGLVCILTAVEPCPSYEIVRHREAKRLELQPRRRKGLHLYHYRVHPALGFMQARIQSWFPFSIQVCLDGREWLARAMDRAGIGYVQRDNCFAWLEDAGPAQRLMDRQVQAAWPELLEGIARSLNPMHDAMFEAFPVEYYWSTFQSEWANDILFRAAAALARLYPRLVHHGLMTLSSPDAMRFPGRHIPPSGRRPPALQADVVSDIKTRPEGVRIKHRLAGNAIKMYDEQGSVLRVETTIDEAAQFKSFRAPEGKPEASKTWQRMRKGIADLNRRAAVSQAANDRICGLWLRWRTPRRRVSRPPGCAGPPSATAVGFARSILTPYALRPRRRQAARGHQPGRLRPQRLPQSRPAPAAVCRQRGIEARTTPPGRSGLPQARPPARSSAHPQGPADTPLPSLRRRPHHRHGPAHRTQRQHGCPDEISRLAKNRRRSRRNARLVIQRNIESSGDRRRKWRAFSAQERPICVPILCQPLCLCASMVQGRKLDRSQAIRSWRPLESAPMGSSRG